MPGKRKGDSLSCQVCCEKFEEKGERIPRLLPCHHSLCEHCIKSLVDEGSIKCPECRKKHKVPGKKEKNFPQNEYIMELIVLRRKMDITETSQKSQSEDITEIDRCTEHGEPKTLYCSEHGCEKIICPSCITLHKKHDVITIKEKQNSLLKDIPSRVENMKSRQKSLRDVQKNIVKETRFTVKKWEEKKQECITYCDNKIEEARKIQKESIEQVDADITDMEENNKLLTNMIEKLKNNSQLVEECTKECASSIIKKLFTYRYPVAKFHTQLIGDSLGSIGEGVVTEIQCKGMFLKANV